MQTSLSAEFTHTQKGLEAEKILRKCVHCGFCNATCPTYQLLGDELDGPRGRIYQMKLLLEGAEPTEKTQLHLDRCLTCRSCETTCPSGVRYGDLLEISRVILEEKMPRTGRDRWLRKLLANVISRHAVFSKLLRFGQMFRGFVPIRFKKKIPSLPHHIHGKWPKPSHHRKMLALAGCAQPSLTPNTNIAAAKLLNQLGISLIEADQAGCCGAVHLHTSEQEQGKQTARNLIDTWLSYLDQGVEAFVMTASGCGVTVKEYPHLFRDDPVYHSKAVQISERTFDLSEVVEKEMDGSFPKYSQYERVAFHVPCTLQHGQKIRGKVEKILQCAGYHLCEVKDGHLCCGSAGTYSLLQSSISDQLRINKQAALSVDQPDVICTANVGCQTQLQINSPIPVIHWVELLI